MKGTLLLTAFLLLALSIALFYYLWKGKLPVAGSVPSITDSLVDVLVGTPLYAALAHTEMEKQLAQSGALI